jgi:hypothetical protein
MNYEYLADAGTYFLRIKMLPSSPGRMRVFVDNHSRLTECRADTNNDYFDAVPLLEYPAPNSPGLGEFCPPYDVEDWFFLQKNDFNPSVGPFQHLELQGGVKGMRVRLYSDSMQFLREAKVNEVGGIVEIDLDGVIQPNEIYRIKVEANPAEERVQIYELRLKNDLIFIFPGFELLQTPQLQLKPEFFKVIVEDDD